MNQTELAVLGGVTLNTQGRYEAGHLPSTEYLLRIGEGGFDWHWILTGSRSSEALEPRSAEALELFLALPTPVQDGMLAMLHAIVATAPSALPAADLSGKRMVHDTLKDFRNE